MATYRPSLGTRGESRRAAAEAETTVVGRVRPWTREVKPCKLAAHVVVPQWVRAEAPIPSPLPKPREVLEDPAPLEIGAMASTDAMQGIDAPALVGEAPLNDADVDVDMPPPPPPLPDAVPVAPLENNQTTGAPAQSAPPAESALAVQSEPPGGAPMPSMEMPKIVDSEPTAEAAPIVESILNASTGVPDALVQVPEAPVAAALHVPAAVASFTPTDAVHVPARAADAPHAPLFPDAIVNMNDTNAAEISVGAAVDEQPGVRGVFPAITPLASAPPGVPTPHSNQISAVSSDTWEPPAAPAATVSPISGELHLEVPMREAPTAPATMEAPPVTISAANEESTGPEGPQKAQGSTNEDVNMSDVAWAVAPKDPVQLASPRTELAPPHIELALPRTELAPPRTELAPLSTSTAMPPILPVVDSAAPVADGSAPAAPSGSVLEPPFSGIELAAVTTPSAMAPVLGPTEPVLNSTAPVTTGGGPAALPSMLQPGPGMHPDVPLASADLTAQEKYTTAGTANPIPVGGAINEGVAQVVLAASAPEPVPPSETPVGIPSLVASTPVVPEDGLLLTTSVKEEDEKKQTTAPFVNAAPDVQPQPPTTGDGSAAHSSPS